VKNKFMQRETAFVDTGNEDVCS